MKKTMILGLAVSAMISLTNTASAGEDPYPATNFQPKIIYQDQSIEQDAHQEVIIDSDYPAAYFQPTVIFSDTEALAKTKQVVEFDPKYPAANFQPKVIYP